MPMSMNKIKVMGQRSRSRRSNQVFSCSRQLYRRLCLSVCLSVCACVCVCVCVSVTHFLPCSYHWIFMKLTPDIDPMKCLWHIQFEVKRSKVKAVILIESSQGESLGLIGMQNLASFIDILSPIFYKKMCNRKPCTFLSFIQIYIMILCAIIKK